MTRYLKNRVLSIGYPVGTKTQVDFLIHPGLSALECSKKLSQDVSLFVKSSPLAGNDISNRHNSIGSRYRRFSDRDGLGLQTRPTAGASD
jgi:hypothetical protein